MTGTSPARRPGVKTMIVTCPNCSTKFNLPDANATPGAKLRCSVCKHVFPLPETAEKQELSLTPKESGIDIDNLPVPEAKKRKNSSGSLIVLLLLLCAVAGGTWYAWTHTALLDGIKSIIVPEKPQEKVDLVSLIALRGMRQYNVSNEKLGNLSVIEGKAVNGFAEPRELIRIEAALYDAEGKTLVSKQQLAGGRVSLFQLQMLGEQELEQALTSKIDIMSNNTNVAPGCEVPFMVVFYNPPDNAAEYGVKIIDARIPPKKK